MNYHIFEKSRNIGGSMTAGVKARCDVEDILDAQGYTRINVLQASYARDTTVNKIKASREIGKQWYALSRKLNSGDVLVVQLPLSEHTLEFGFVIAGLKSKGVKTVAVVHDLEKLRNMKAHNPIKAWKGHIRNFLEETWALKNFSKIIVHNNRMLERMIAMGYSEAQIVTLDIFDYLVKDNPETEKVGDPEGIIIAGNLLESKSGYVYKLPSDERVKFSLYGVNYTGEGNPNTRYNGAFDPDILPLVLCGKYGLVWDGPEAHTCSGIHGEYIRINNPHKTSLYLAAGIPVIIWEQAALADFIKTHNVGICVDSIGRIPDAISAVSSEEYARMCCNAANIGQRIRNGEFLKTALKNCLN